MILYKIYRSLHFCSLRFLIFFICDCGNFAFALSRQQNLYGSVLLAKYTYVRAGKRLGLKLSVSSPSDNGFCINNVLKWKHISIFIADFIYFIRVQSLRDCGKYIHIYKIPWALRDSFVDINEKAARLIWHRKNSFHRPTCTMNVGIAKSNYIRHISTCTHTHRKREGERPMAVSNVSNPRKAIVNIQQIQTHIHARIGYKTEWRIRFSTSICRCVSIGTLT